MTTSFSNPYADLLKGRDALSLLSDMPYALEHALGCADRLNAQERVSPTSWSTAEIVCHLVDAETVFAFRIRKVMAEKTETITLYDQDAWLALYQSPSVDESFAAFAPLRRWNVALLKTLAHALPEAVMVHPIFGEIPFVKFVELMAGHDLNHLAQIERNLAAGC